jgi:hypothetical protein
MDRKNYVRRVLLDDIREHMGRDLNGVLAQSRILYSQDSFCSVLAKKIDLLLHNIPQDHGGQILIQLVRNPTAFTKQFQGTILELLILPFY